MKKYIFAGLLLSLICILISCKKNENLFNGTVKQIVQFSQEQTLLGEKLPYINNIAFFGCEITYPYLLLHLSKQDYFTGIYDVSQGKYIGDFFRKGEGPSEFLNFVIINQKMDSVLWIHDLTRQGIKAIHISKTIDSGETVINEEISYKGYSDPLVVFRTKDSGLWIKNFSVADGVTYSRFKSDISNTIPLYNKELSINDLNKTKTLADCIKDDETQIASLTGVLNQIDILDISHPERNISVTTSSEMITFDHLVSTHDNDLIDYYLSLPRCNDSFIIALYNNEHEQKKELHLIDWNGNGLCKYKFNENIIDFCIDWKNQVIYGVTKKEEVYRYNIELPKSIL